MQTRKKQLDIYLAIMLAITVAAVCLRSISVLTALDFSLGRYSDKTLVTIADWITVGGSVLLLSYTALSAKGAKYRASFSGAATYVPTALVAASLLHLSVSLATTVLRSLGGRRFNPALIQNPAFFMPILAAAFAIAAIYYFFLNSYLKNATSERRAGAAFILILFLCIYPAYLYFDAALPINAPNKLVDQMSYLFSALFFLYEARISLGRDKWGGYVSFGLVAALLTAYSSIPSAIAYFVKGECISNSIAEIGLTLSLFVFIICRLITVRSLYDDRMCEAAAGAIARHKARRELIADSDLIFAEGEQLEFEMPMPVQACEDEIDEQDEPDAEETVEQESDTAYETAEELSDIAEEEGEAPTAEI